MKTAMAFCILLTGVCAAVLFRRDPQPPAAAPAMPVEQAVACTTTASPPPVERRRKAKPRHVEASVAQRVSPRAATIVTPSARLEPPPSLANKYPSDGPIARASWKAAMDLPSSEAVAAEGIPQTHKIVDGDTLAGLAERYLGSAARAGEIFEANRNVLSSPELLPIGVELQIPPRNRTGAERTLSSGSAEGALVPVFHGR